MSTLLIVIKDKRVWESVHVELKMRIYGTYVSLKDGTGIIRNIYVEYNGILEYF